MSRYLVTGGCGFIGRHLCAALVEAGQAVTVLDDLSSGDATALPQGARLLVGDLCDAAALADAMDGADGVFHLAAVSSVEACTRHRAATRRVNVAGTRAVVTAAGARPLVFASSAAVYGDQPDLPIAESAALAPISPYAEDKVAGEALVDRAAQAGGRAVIARPFNVFGPGQAAESPYSGVITRFLTQAATGQRLRINGDGSQTRDFVHVRDVAQGLARAMDWATAAPAGSVERVNLCRGAAVTVRALAETLLRLSGSETAPETGPPRPGDIRHSRGDPARARSLLGFTATVTLDQGLAELVEKRS